MYSSMLEHRNRFFLSIQILLTFRDRVLVSYCRLDWSPSIVNRYHCSAAANYVTTREEKLAKTGTAWETHGGQS
jgi:hypothetical protein